MDLNELFNFGPRFNAKQLSLIIGFDRLNYNLKIMRFLGTNFNDCKVDYIPVDQSLFLKGDWEAILTCNDFTEYINNQHFDSSFAVYIVLPDNFVGTDILTIPAIKKSQQMVALETQMKELYFFYNDYKFNYILLDSNKSNVSYEIIMVNKSLLNTVYKALSVNKLYVKESTYAANAIINSALYFMPKLKKTSFIIMDLKSGSCELVAVSNGQTCGWTELKFGYAIFSLPKVQIENNLVYNDIANIAVINATEKAKKKKMTEMSGDEDEDLIEENAITLNEINADGENVSDSEVEEMRSKREAELAVESETASVSQSVENTGNGAVSAADKQQNEPAADGAVQAQTEEVKKPEPPKVKAYTRKIKKLPAYMMREEPTDHNGVIYENFRLFIKHALLMKMQMESGVHYSAPTQVVVNLPKDYAFVIDEANKEGNGIDFKLFEPNKECDVSLTENLDMFGAVVMNAYNKRNNF